MSSSPSEVFSNALRWYQEGRFQQSAQLLNTLLQANIVSPDILNLMASSLFRLGDIANAEKLFQASLEMKSDYAQTHLHAAGFFRETNRFDRAVTHYLKSFEFDRSNVQSLMDGALLLQQAESWPQAEQLIDQYLQNAGDKFEGFIRKAVCRYSLFDYESSEALLQQAESLNPNQVISSYYRALLFDKTKRKQEAREIFERLISEGHEPSKFSLSLLHFSEGRWDEAFALYDNRPVARMLNDFCRDNGENFWDGSSTLVGKHVLVYAEQGIGDQIRYMYFLDQLLQDASKVSVIYDDRLYPILEQGCPQINCIPSQSISAELLQTVKPDICLCVGSLGRIYGAQLSSRAISSGLARYDAEFVRYHSDKNWLPNKSHGRPLIGLSWRSIRYIKERSDWYCTAEDYALLLEGIEADFVSLQYDLKDKERSAFAARGIKLVELDDLDLKDDQAELAAVISGLDHVISVSTAMSELAGATGVPTTIFAIEDIRWFMAQDHIRGFYPNAQVFYKTMFQSWDGAILKARKNLVELYGVKEGAVK